MIRWEKFPSLEGTDYSIRCRKLWEGTRYDDSLLLCYILSSGEKEYYNFSSFDHLPI